MGFDIDRLIQLWDGPVRDGKALYADPETVDGRPIAAGTLVAFAPDMHETFHDRRRTALERVDRVTAVSTAAGVGTDRPAEILVNDLLTVRHRRDTAERAVSQPAAPAQGG